MFYQSRKIMSKNDYEFVRYIIYQNESKTFWEWKIAHEWLLINGHEIFKIIK